MSRDWIIAIGGGIISAIASLAFLGGVPGVLLLVYLAPLPLMMVGLAFGPAAAAVASVAGALAAGAIGTAVATVLFAVIHGLPAWMTVHLALRNQPAEETRRQKGVANETSADKAAWYPAGHVLAWLTALGCGSFLIMVFFIAGGAGEFKDAVTNYLDQVLSMLAPALPKENRIQVLSLISPLFPALVGATWLVVTAVNGAMAQGIVKRMGRALRPSPSYRNLSLPNWLSWLLVGTAAMALTGPLMGMVEMEYMGRNLVAVSAVPFFFLGVAVLRYLVRKPMFIMMVIISASLFLTIPGWTALLVTGIGLTEHWIGLRRFFPGQPGVS